VAGGSAEGSILEVIHTVFEEKIPFNQLLGFEIESLDLDRAVIRFAHRRELVGNFVRGSLHGGVISAVLDTTGGLILFLHLLSQLEGESREKMLQRLGNIGTVDLRVDYLRAGVGEEYRATGYILRTGNKVAVTRMELHDQDDTLVAVGTGTYLIG